VTVTKDQLRVHVSDGKPVQFSVRGVVHEAALGRDAVVPLAHQGPRLSGRPTIGQFAHTRREDGTLMSASVPVTTSSIPVVDYFD